MSAQASVIQAQQMSLELNQEKADVALKCEAEMRSEIKELRQEMQELRPFVDAHSEKLEAQRRHGVRNWGLWEKNSADMKTSFEEVRSEVVAMSVAKLRIGSNLRSIKSEAEQEKQFLRNVESKLMNEFNEQFH